MLSSLNRRSATEIGCAFLVPALKSRARITRSLRDREINCDRRKYLRGRNRAAAPTGVQAPRPANPYHVPTLRGKRVQLRGVLHMPDGFVMATESHQQICVGEMCVTTARIKPQRAFGFLLRS